MTRRRMALLLLAVLGVAISSYLTYIALQARPEPLCTGLGDCGAVQQSTYARVAGVPVAMFGLAMYLALLALLGLRSVVDSADTQLLRTWTFAIALGGVVYSAYLTYLEIAVIGAICEWCVASALVITAVCALSLPDLRADAGESRPSARRA